MMASMVEYNAKTKDSNVTFCGIQEKKTETDQNKAETFHLGDMMIMSTKRKKSWIPHLFERSSRKWWNPQMDSEILEKQCQECWLEQSISYFQRALMFIVLASISWIIYFSVKNLPAGWIGGVAWASGLIVVCVIIFIVTKRHKIYKKCSSYIAIGVAVILMVTVCLAAFYGNVIMTSVGSFFLAAEVILLLYTVMPLPLHINFIMGVVFSIAYEIFYNIGADSVVVADIFAHLFLHICIHLLGLQICMNLQVRRRSTFWKVGQIIQSTPSGTVKFKNLMINSIMPPSVKDKLMAMDGGDLFQTNAKQEGKFRRLYVERMKDVSILYADIVGFTKMSANKTAATLVYLLNDLFGRFDTLCQATGCEKISTLGDCYYCVAGCPEPKDDHAKCCVEMGLGMISAIRDFCAENNVNVDMRIGIHTGIVICGIVGKKRFKFDVWSNDVSFANQMEQWGVPGRIHISESTRECLGDLYKYEDGKIEERAPKEVIEKKNVKQTYLIVDPAESETSSTSGDTSDDASEDADQELTDQENNKLSIQNETGVLANGISLENIDQNQNAQEATQDATNNQRSSVTGSRVMTSNKDTLPEAPCHGQVLSSHLFGEFLMVGVTKETSSVEKNRPNGTSDLENASPADPLLLVKRTSTHHHHSSRKKKKKLSESEPKVEQPPILRLFGLPVMLPVLNPAESSLRMDQDREFVSIIRNDSRMKNINNTDSMKPISMRFKKTKIEEGYCDKFHTEVEKKEPITSFVSARFSFFLDLLISFILFVLVFAASMLSFGVQVDNVAWIVFFCIFFCLQLFVVIVAGIYVLKMEDVPPWVKNVVGAFAGWVPRHIVGVITLCCPAGIMFSNMWCRTTTPPFCTYYLIIAGVVIIHFLNFNQLSSWIRSIIASLVAITATTLVYANPCPGIVDANNTTAVITQSICTRESLVYQYEFILDIILLMLFIYIVNMEYEIGHRLTYNSAYEAEEMEKERSQIDQLLHLIIPPRVTDVMRRDNKNTYSQNHENVGVIFCSIINFNDFYEESYAGGTECIRILNELISDVDELLDKKHYEDVEKIKTIGSTFMIASGLNPSIARDPNDNSHLHTLMHFCVEMQELIREFSNNMVCFTFILRIGFNHGSVTAGVIGSTKLLYDIWGDTVNIASRMDSTGEPNKIQVSDGSMRCLVPHYKFRYRGNTYVKGKGEMQTYILVIQGEKTAPENPKPTPVNFPGQTS